MSQAPTQAASPAPRIGRWTLWRVFWRSFFFLAASNYERMQNVGFAYAMAPALGRLYQGEALKAAMARHLGFFNSHPYLAAAVLGASIRLEERVAAGELPPEMVVGLKRVAQGPLAAIGDSFFWSSLRPFAAVWTIGGLASGVFWAPLAFLALYNLFHIGLRAYGLWVGYRDAEGVLPKLQQFNLVKLADMGHFALGAFSGVLVALFADQARRSSLPLGDGIEPILMLALTLIFFLSIRRKMPTIGLLFGASLALLGYVLVLNGLFPLW
ncbi:MAG: PTS system mannose/fructose/sorbose family transporter subunit IID [Myxococcales bacterium]|nr:PTS system mannose/fructose/sorbose family transporter subunit IID [Myxococcales bacterium]MCB9525352.1 PTS system mannose/fructose/sorbose family transporter subunit IID [Myxococcales bacterium]